MTMQLKQKNVTISPEGSRKITIAEAGWDYSFRFSELEKQLAPLLEDPAQSEVFKFFCVNYYPLMASCVVGDAPSAQEAIALPRLYLDNWYLTMWELNEDIIGSPCPAQLENEEVKFRDGSSIHIWRAHGLPSFILRLVELEAFAAEHPIENDPQGQLFQLMFYPKMAAACNGSEIPDALTARDWPRSELNKWLEASRRMNPDWYALTEPEEEKLKEKKKEKRKSAG